MTKDTGGPAFPRAPIGDDCNAPYGHQDGMTLRQYAAIKLRVPDSGTDWLDDMIREGRRMDYAGQAMNRFTDWHGDRLDDMAQRAKSIADAMLAECEK